MVARVKGTPQGGPISVERARSKPVQPWSWLILVSAVQRPPTTTERRSHDHARVPGWSRPLRSRIEAIRPPGSAMQCASRWDQFGEEMVGQTSVGLSLGGGRW